MTESKFISAQKSRNNEPKDDIHKFHFGYGGFHLMGCFMKVRQTHPLLSLFYDIYQVHILSFEVNDQKCAQITGSSFIGTSAYKNGK